MTEPIRFEKNITDADLEKFKREFDEAVTTREVEILSSHGPTTIYGVHSEGEMTEFLSIPKAEIPTIATLYVDSLEVEQSRKWCKCEWIIHPDDLEMPEGQRRMRRGAQDEQCPVHTRVGFILGFFEFVFSPEWEAWREEHKNGD